MTKKIIIGCLFLYILSICIEYYPKGKEYNEGNYCSISDSNINRTIFYYWILFR